MGEIGFKTLESLLCMIELGIFHIWMSRCCKKRKMKWWMQSGLFIAIGITLSIMTEFRIEKPIQMLIALGLLLVYSCMSFKTKKYLYLLYISLYFLIIIVCENLCVSILGMMFPEVTMEQLMELRAMRYQVGMLSKLLLAILVIFFSHYIIMNREQYSKWNIGLILIVISISCIFMYSLAIFKVDMTKDILGISFDSFMCFTSIGLFILNLILYGVIMQLNDKVQKEKEYEFIQYQMEILNQTLIESKDVEKEWRKVKHDFNNHLSCIDMLLQMENIPKARAYIQNLTQNWQDNSYSIHTGNSIADAVINQKLIKAKKEAIYFNVNGEISNQLHIEDVDLCALLSNSIDNAIEASCQLGDEKRRRIDISLSSTDSSMLIEVNNEVKENIEPVKKLKTTKGDKKRHGIGMMSMQTTANKYGGIVEWKCQNYRFNLRIFIPLIISGKIE